MNKRKITIFVEGDTELIFVRNFLNTWYNYDANSLGVECYKLQSNQPNPVPYLIGSRDSENFYQIIIVGNDKFKQIAQETIDNSQLPNKSTIHIHFAIMEVESWLLGMESLLAYLDTKLDLKTIKEELGLDLSEDPETTVYHPAYKLEQLFALADKQYGKHTDVTEKLLSKLMRTDYEQLYHSGKCRSFHEFVDLII